MDATLVLTKLEPGIIDPAVHLSILGPLGDSKPWLAEEG